MYKKITVNFRKISKIRRLLKAVYEAKSNHLDGILKFKLRENIKPSDVEKVEIKISSPLSEEVITIPRSGLTFLTGDNLPYRAVEHNSVVEDRYMILPWKLDTENSRLDLKNLIKKIPKRLIGMVCSLSYSLFVNIGNQANTGEASITALAALATAQTTAIAPAATPKTAITTTRTTRTIPRAAFSQANPVTVTTTLAAPTVQTDTANTQIINETLQDFSWSGSSFSEDNEERLLNEIEQLKRDVQDRDRKIADLEKGWCVELVPLNVSTAPRVVMNGNTIRSLKVDSRVRIIANDVKHNAVLANMTGNIAFDIDNHKLIINGTNFGLFDAQ